MTCLLHHLYHAVKRHTVRAVGERGVSVGIQRSSGCIGIALYARNLHHAAHRVARHAQMMFKPHLGGIFYLCRASAKQLRRRSGSHRTRHPYFSLAPGFGTRDRGVVLHYVAHKSGGGESAQHTHIAEIAAFLKMIEHGRHHAA